MTDRLATLMHGEMETLDVPGVPTPEILAAGHRLRRRRTWTRVTAASGVIVVALATVAAVTLGDHSSTTPGPASTAKDTPTLAYGIDDTVYVGDDATPVQLPEVAQTLYYTSAGILVRTNKDGSSDGGAPFHFELIGVDGKATKLGVTLGEVVPSTDATQPYLAWATMSDGKIQVVVHDVSTDQDVARVDVPGSFTWGGWDAPPVSLSGDLVYVGTDDHAEVVDWRTGQAHASDVVPGSTFATIVDGRYLDLRDGGVDVLDAESGKVLMHASGAVNDAELSPDGRFAVVSQGGQDKLYDLDTGATSHISLSSYGWAYDGDSVYGVSGSTLTSCSTITGACHETHVPPVGRNAMVRYPGQAFES